MLPSQLQDRHQQCTDLEIIYFLNFLKYAPQRKLFQINDTSRNEIEVLPY